MKWDGSEHESPSVSLPCCPDSHAVFPVLGSECQDCCGGALAVVGWHRKPSRGHKKYWGAPFSPVCAAGGY